MNINDAIICPKCQKQFMNKSVTGHPKPGMEYFCHNCHLYFGVNELVNSWGYDAADLYPSYPVTHANYKGWYKSSPQKVYYSEYADGEPMWSTIWERKEAYRMVGRMHLGVPEIDDLTDLRNTEACALDIGVR